MHAQELRAKAPRRQRVTTQSAHVHLVVPKLLARRFDEARPDRVWTADVTCLSTRADRLYLSRARPRDARRRRLGAAPHAGARTHARPVGHGRASPPTRAGCVAPRAPEEPVRVPGLSGAAHGARHDLRHEPERDCWNDAVAESFFATLKRELADGAGWATRDDARRRADRRLPLQRGLVQPAAAALSAGLRQPRAVQTPACDVCRTTSRPRGSPNWVRPDRRRHGLSRGTTLITAPHTADAKASLRAGLRRRRVGRGYCRERRGLCLSRRHNYVLGLSPPK